MTAEIELLPLPEVAYVNDEGLWEERYGPYSREEMQDYARDNVEYHAAPLRAEIDALRTRLEDTVRDSTNKIEALRAEREAIVAEAKKYAGESGRLKAKVELLMEALEVMVEMVEMNGFGRDYAMDVARAALAKGEE